jgi:hypothetical protein
VLLYEESIIKSIMQPTTDSSHSIGKTDYQAKKKKRIIAPFIKLDAMWMFQISITNMHKCVTLFFSSTEEKENTLAPL